MESIKLKDNIDLNLLKEFGFQKDINNCESGDHYYHLNNYFIEIGNFRITVNTVYRNIDILCLAKDAELYNIGNLKPLYELISKDMVELECDSNNFAMIDKEYEENEYFVDNDVCGWIKKLE